MFDLHFETMLKCNLIQQPTNAFSQRSLSFLFFLSFLFITYLSSISHQTALFDFSQCCIVVFVWLIHLHTHFLIFSSPHHIFQLIHPQCASLLPVLRPFLPSIRGVRLPHWLWWGGSGERSVWHGAVQSLRGAHWRGGDCRHGAKPRVTRVDTMGFLLLCTVLTPFFLNVDSRKVRSVLLAIVQKEIKVHPAARPIHALKVINNTIKYILKLIGRHFRAT